MKDKKSYSGYIISFCLPCLVFTFLLAVFKIAPFGDYTLFFHDMSGQYISFFSYLKQMLAGQQSTLYTFSKLLGGDLQGLISYYLLSPFNFIVLLFKTSDMALAVSTLVLLKIGSCGITSYFFLSKRSDNTALKLIFSTAYALMAYNIVYAQNIMWLDGVIILPIIAVGIDKLLDENKFLTYIMALSYGIITNYYIGYMLCGFSVIYFGYRLLLKNGIKLSELLKKSALFAYSSITSGMLSGFVLLPTLKSLEGTSKQSMPLAEMLSFGTNISASKLIKHIFFPSVTLNDLNTNLPNVYVGLFVLLMAILFFASRKIKFKEKLLSLAVLVVFIGSFYFITPNLMWHGFVYPVCFSFRFSFIFSFFIILFAFRFMENCEVSDKKLALYGLLAANTITLFALAYANIRTMYMTDNTFKTFYNDVSPSVESIKETEKDSFYRVEKDFNYSHNDGMTFGYNGLEHYSSGEKLATRRLPRIMGYTVREALGMYNTGSFLGADSFLGVKYFMSYGQGKKGTEKINECNGISTYKNPYALPLVFESSQELLELPVSKLHTADAAGEIMSVALKEEYSFTNLQGTVEQELVNVEKIENDDGEQYSIISVQEPSYINYTFKAQQAGNVYLYIDTSELPKVEVTFRDKNLGEYLIADNFGIMPLGTLEEDETASVSIKMYSDFKASSVQFFYDDNGDLERMSQQIASQQVRVDDFKSSRFEVTGEILNENSGLFFMVPNQEGWVIKADGKNVEYKTVLDTFIYLPMEKGKFAISVRFVPPGLYQGVAITLIGILQLASVLVLKKKSFKIE